MFPIASHNALRQYWERIAADHGDLLDESTCERKPPGRLLKK
jgi:hypothetical protein